MKHLCMILLALGTVPAFAQQQPITTQQWITTVPYKDWDGNNYSDGTCSGWTVQGDVIQCAFWDRYPPAHPHAYPWHETINAPFGVVIDNVRVMDAESVNDLIPADAVAPLYREHEPYCPTTEYRIRWFVVEDPLSGKTFSARCVPSK